VDKGIFDPAVGGPREYQGRLSTGETVTVRNCRCVLNDDSPVNRDIVKDDPSMSNCEPLDEEVNWDLVRAFSEEAPKPRPWSDPALVSRWTPWITVLLLEGANVGQLWRMWTAHSSLGQNPYSWMLVGAALLLWINFYRVNRLRAALVATLVGVLLNTLVWVSVFYWRAHGR
jgi:hypothetical protein